MRKIVPSQGNKNLFCVFLFVNKCKFYPGHTRNGEKGNTINVFLDYWLISEEIKLFLRKPMQKIKKASLSSAPKYLGKTRQS